MRMDAIKFWLDLMGIERGRRRHQELIMDYAEPSCLRSRWIKCALEWEWGNAHFRWLYQQVIVRVSCISELFSSCHGGSGACGRIQARSDDNDTGGGVASATTLAKGCGDPFYQQSQCELFWSGSTDRDGEGCGEQQSDGGAYLWIHWQYWSVGARARPIGLPYGLVLASSTFVSAERASPQLLPLLYIWPLPQPLIACLLETFVIVEGVNTLKVWITNVCFDHYLFVYSRHNNKWERLVYIRRNKCFPYVLLLYQLIFTYLF